MSDLKSKQIAAELLRDALNAPAHPGTWHLWLGVVYPAAVIAFELATRWCAQTFFDPMPTWVHAAVVAAVPAGNLALWLALRGPRAADPRHLAILSGVTLGVGAFYSLVFLPLLPIAVLAVLFYGLGLLPMGPIVSFMSATGLWRALKTRYPGRPLRKPLLAGVLTSIAILIALDVPAAATRIGLSWAASRDMDTRQRGLVLLRTLGDDELLLRLCYDTAGRPSGLLSGLTMLTHSGVLGAETQTRLSTQDIREVYYRVHGEPFNAKPAPFQGQSWARFPGFQWDGDHGGTNVGGRIKGLDLVSSRIDGTIDAADAVGYLEWIVEFRNTSPLDRETRLQLALPPDAVVSRATLWVNGEEREAAYAGRGAVRAAYERVAVQQRRDPLLVTTKGADRVLVQAFPVPRDGGTIKFKIGITAPLALGGDKAKLDLPAIVERNFSVSEDVKHTLWLESRAPLQGSGTTLASEPAAAGAYRMRASFTDRELTLDRPAIMVPRPSNSRPVVARIGQGPEVIQTVEMLTTPAPGALAIVIDGSVRAASAATALKEALDAIPEGIPVGVILADARPGTPVMRPWTKADRMRVERLLAEARFTGGQDNTPALTEALFALEPYDNAALLWMHGPQPLSFRETSGVLEQAAQRLTRRPQLWLYGTEPGPNELLPDIALTWQARTVPRAGKPNGDLEAFMRNLFSQEPQPQLVRTERKPGLASEHVESIPQGSAHIARLWARDRVLALAAGRSETARKAAIDLAAAHRIVTPVSGAVVLETAQQFADAGLTPVTQQSVPTVPEPHEWALILISAISFLWLLWRQRQERGLA